MTHPIDAKVADQEITTNVFLNSFNVFPVPLLEVSGMAIKVSDNQKLQDAARNYLAAELALKSVLEEIRFG